MCRTTLATIVTIVALFISTLLYCFIYYLIIPKSLQVAPINFTLQEMDINSFDGSKGFKPSPALRGSVPIDTVLSDY